MLEGAFRGGHKEIEKEKVPPQRPCALQGVCMALAMYAPRRRTLSLELESIAPVSYKKCVMFEVSGRTFVGEVLVARHPGGNRGNTILDLTPMRLANSRQRWGAIAPSLVDTLA